MITVGDKVSIKTERDMLRVPRFALINYNGKLQIVETVHLKGEELVLIRVAEHELDRLGEQGEITEIHPEFGITVRFEDGKIMTWVTEDMIIKL